MNRLMKGLFGLGLVLLYGLIAFIAGWWFTRSEPTPVQPPVRTEVAEEEKVSAPSEQHLLPSTFPEKDEKTEKVEEEITLDLVPLEEATLPRPQKEALEQRKPMERQAAPAEIRDRLRPKASSNAPVKKRLGIVPRRDRGQARELLKVLEQNPNAFRVEILWMDPLTHLERHLEYRRDTETLTRWDASLWEQWREFPIEGLYYVAEGYPLNNWGVYSRSVYPPGMADRFRFKRDMER